MKRLLLVLAMVSTLWLMPKPARACEVYICFDAGTGGAGQLVTCCQLLPDPRPGCYYSCTTFWCAEGLGGTQPCPEMQG